MKRKIAVVTGGVRRLGRDISVELAEAGYFVIPVFNSSTESDVDLLRKKLHVLTEFEILKYDLSSAQNIHNLFDYIEKKYSAIDLLVNNAAIFEKRDFFETDAEFWDKFMNINLRSVFLCSQYAAKIMLKDLSHKRSIINIASLGAYENWTGYIPYSVSKSGVVKLTEQMAKRLAPDILVNAIAPGTIVIEGDENITVDEKEISKYPLKKFGESKDVTKLVRFLAVDNEFITGQTIKVDGGRTL